MCENVSRFDIYVYIMLYITYTLQAMNYGILRAPLPPSHELSRMGLFSWYNSPVFPMKCHESKKNVGSELFSLVDTKT